MSNMRLRSTKEDLDSILNFVDRALGLSARVGDGGDIIVRQDVDSKLFKFSVYNVIEILNRFDGEANPFLQLNFKSSQKVLLTDSLVGFKPHQTLGLDMNKLPKVVTTPDLVSVFEAIEEALGSDQIDHEIEILKKHLRIYS